MKNILLTIIICILTSGSIYSQKISLSLNNASLEKTFKEIRKQTGYSFVYTREQINKSNTVNINVKDASLSQVLDICFNNQPLTFTIDKKYIIVKDKFEKELPPTNGYIDITGKVINTQNEPVVGATITVKHTNIATATDESGKFALKKLKKNDDLIITSIGYLQSDVPLYGRSNVIIELQTNVSRLDETIIIAYGNTTRRFSTGSVTKVSSDEISEQPISNPLAALQGRVPGLVVTSTSGLPGSSFSIQIRGQNSLNPDPYNTLSPKDNPLFIIDGVPFAPQNNNLNQLRSIASPGDNILLNNSYGGISPFNSINPSDIESIEVLRDADATAIYGSRGANGVVLITTKKGRAGKTKFNMNIYTGISRVAHTLPMMNTKQYLEMRREAFANDGVTPSNTNPSNFRTYAPDLTIYDTTKYTDWKKFFIGNPSYTTNINTSFSGGSENTQFLLGAGYYHETYIYPGNFSYDRASVNLNLHHNSIDKKLSLDYSSEYSFDKNNSSGTPNLLRAYALDPDFPNLLDENGNLLWNYKGARFGVSNVNPLSYLKKKYSITNFNLINHLQVAYKIIPGLEIRSSFGYNYLNSIEYSGDPALSQDPALQRVASADFGTKNIHNWIIEPQAEYSKVFGKSKINILLGGTFEEDVNSSNIISGSGYTNDMLITSISGAPDKTARDAYSQYKYNAIFGRINYVLNQRYILNLNGRRDGSSRFGPGKQFGNFGSIGTGWIFSDESLIKKTLKWLSYGKLRGSYGTTGSDAIGDYQYIARWQPTDYYYQGYLGYLPQNLFNPDFSWAITKKTESAIELGFLKDRLFLSAIWYRNSSGNQLVYFQLPSQTGFSNVTENWSAKVQNTGWEFVVTSSNLKTKRFSWNTSFNLTVPRNKLVSFPGIASSSYATKYVVGQPLSVLKGFKYLGVNDTTGVFQFLTADRVPTYSPVNISGNKFNDIQVIGNLDPKFFGGLNNSFTYRGFQLDIFIEFKKQPGVNYLAQIYGVYVPGAEYNLPAALLSRWQKPGDKTEFEKLTTNVSSPAGKAARTYFTQSSGVYGDASYIRVKTVSFSYSLHGKYLEKLKAETVRFYVNAQNLLTITNYKGNDPETQNFYGVPPLRTIAVGFQLNF
ncbi:MAG: SusC/RagA family TonB-linked outer membrane protein [Bacteroidota bacterium]|nr:SusC/RagA family TonB-linked outer membrane protein [Bacteroidota bacterium]